MILIAHRYAGLVISVFLLLTAITGSILVWEQELDVALNPDLLLNQSNGDHLPADAMLKRLKARHPDVRFGFTLLHRDNQRSAVIYASGWQDQSGRDVNQVFVDRATAQVLGARNSTSPSFFSRREFVPWVMRFHWSLTLSWGAKALGIVAIIWLLDCLLAWYLTLPRKRFTWQLWKTSWQIKRTRLSFDLHRALSLWFLPLFVVLAVSGIYFNLNNEVFKPLLRTMTEVTAKPYEQPPLETPIHNPEIDFTQGLHIARKELAKHSIIDNGVSYLSYNPRHGYYLFGFYSVNDIARDTVAAQVYLKPSGDLLQLHEVSAGTIGDNIIDWQFALHSGQAFGLIGRWLIFFAGIALSIISISGIMIWLRKRKARLNIRSKSLAIKEASPEAS